MYLSFSMKWPFLLGANPNWPAMHDSLPPATAGATSSPPLTKLVAPKPVYNGGMNLSLKRNNASTDEKFSALQPEHEPNKEEENDLLPSSKTVSPANEGRALSVSQAVSRSVSQVSDSLDESEDEFHRAREVVETDSAKAGHRRSPAITPNAFLPHLPAITPAHQFHAWQYFMAANEARVLNQYNCLINSRSRGDQQLCGNRCPSLLNPAFSPVDISKWADKFVSNSQAQRSFADLHYGGPLRSSHFGKKYYNCPQCRYITDRKNNLKRHVATMHQDTDRLLECCGLSFKNKAMLRDHVSIFHRSGYMCRFCGRNFCRKALLKRHLAVHSGQKDFVCGVCDYATSHKSNLDRHRKVHERSTSDDEIMGDCCHDDRHDVTINHGHTHSHDLE